MNESIPPETIVIAGAGVAGGTAALTLRAEGYGGRVVLVGEEPVGPYVRPPMSKRVLRGEMDAADAQLRPARAWQDEDVELRTGTTVTAVDPSLRTVTFADGSALGYDRLLLATGGGSRQLPGHVAQPETSARVHYLRTQADATALRGELGGGRSVLVVGAGLVGLEVAATARSLGCQVTVVEVAGRPLDRVLPPVVGDVVTDLHRRNDVDLQLSVRLTRLAETGSGVVAVADDGRSWQADLCVVAVGMVPRSGLAAQAGLRVSSVTGGVVVDEYCATGVPGVYAAGDLTDQPHPLGGRYRIEHFRNAQEQAGAAARNMLGIETPYLPTPSCWSEQYGVYLSVCGWPSAANMYGTGTTLRGDPERLDFTVVCWRADRMVAAVSCGRADEFRALQQIIDAEPYADFELLADPATDLVAVADRMAN